jgi:hypothetical protein
MRWTPGGRSDDLEDDRAEGGSGFRPVHGMSLGGFLLLLVLSLVFKRDFFALFNTGSSRVAPTTHSRPLNDPAEETQVQFVSFVLDDTQKTWTRIMQERGRPYPHAKLVLFRDAVNSACGLARSATGPFYCPADQKVYIDLGFYDELKRRFGSPGDFAQAYVLAHEIGHHVQRLLGVEGTVRRAMRANPGARNDLSVRMELQADCFAGIWAHSTEKRKILEPGDVEEALHAAASIGDDRIQRMSGRQISPESFTHGSSAQRVHWLQQGMTSGSLESCNTFAH